MSKNISKHRNTAKQFASIISVNRNELIGDIQTLRECLSNVTGTLTLDDRKTIVEQALTLLERYYVHLPLKKVMHAVDPVQKLRLLQAAFGCI